MTRDDLASASMGFSAKEWELLKASTDELDKLTVRNAQATADNLVRGVPEIANAIRTEIRLAIDDTD